jgi:serine/threonine protein kinase
MWKYEQSGAKLYELRAKLLEARFFGGTTALMQGDSSSPDDGSSSDQVRHTTELDEQETRSTFETAAMGDVDNAFLSSANLCRWVIDYDDIQLGRQVGMGSYGLVFHGRWKGMEVAVKRFIKQKLTECRLLEFRAEMAFLSELHHPNVVVFIGACVKTPNLCIVTEFVKQGALRDILYNGASSSSQGSPMSPRGQPRVRIEWRQRLQMLRSAAVGINFLHTLEPTAIIHRDLKSSNLLVDENWNVKVADFGFARLKEENVTMTRCGTPCWTGTSSFSLPRHSAPDSDPSLCVQRRR